MEKTTVLPKQTVVISGELHSFIKMKAAQPENKGQNIGSLIERAIRNYYGVDENGEPIIDPDKTPDMIVEIKKSPGKREPGQRGY